MSKQAHPIIEKLLHFRIVILIIVLFMIFLSVGIFFSIDTGNNTSGKNKDDFYKTWKVQRFYQNGKLVVNDKKFEDLRIKINRDSTAEWIRPNSTQKFKTWVTEDCSQIVKLEEDVIPDVDFVYEISEDRLRFGKRNVMTHYEYVLIPEDSGK